MSFPSLPADDLERPIYVSSPLLPSLDAYQAQLADIWSSKQLTNGGQKSILLETALSSRLAIDHVSLTSNGTIALMMACRALKLTGEVITTPFTFIATVHALAWCGLKPVFVDIDPVTMTISPERIEEAITADTCAIVGVHVYGNRCDVEGIDVLAKRHNLKVIYDAAHAFTTSYKGRSIAAYGDMTAYSFHATKLFHTGEGGALATADSDLDAAARSVRNFGIASEESIPGTGINGKLSELQAAMGLAVLPLLDEEKQRRQQIFAHYNEAFARVPGITAPHLGDIETDSFQYYCLRIKPGGDTPNRDEVYSTLRTRGIFSRRYFWPLCSDVEEYRGLESADPIRLPNARAASNEVLCLPLYGSLNDQDVKRIVNAVYEACGIKQAPQQQRTQELSR